MTLNPSITTLKNKADKIFSQVVRSRGVCERCHRKPPEVRLETAHIFSRRFVTIRCDLNNVFCLCSACHRWAHDRPYLFAKFIDVKIDKDKIETLTKESSRVGAQTDWLSVIDKLCAIARARQLECKECPNE